MSRIYVWRCAVCEKKGATTLKPLPNQICLFCGHSLDIEVFSDVFWTLQHTQVSPKTLLQKRPY